MRKIRDFFKNKKFTAGCATAALAVLIAGTMLMQDFGKAPELPVYTDPLMEVSIEEEETPLAAAPKVSSNTTKKSSNKKVKMKTAAVKSYTKKLPATKKKSSKTTTQNGVTVKTDTSVLTNVTEKYTKKSQYKLVTTNVVTTVTKTTFAQEEAPQGSASGSSGDVQTGSSTFKYDTTAAKAAPRMDARVLNAFDKLGFTMKVDPSVSYAGHFDAKARTIILRKEDETSYHELGHFLAFITGNADKSAAFTTVYNQERNLFTGVNKAYATQNSSEYFAESVKDYIINAAALRGSRPLTCAAVEDALNKVTDAQISKVLMIYGPVWNK